MQPQNNRPNDHSDERGYDQQRDHGAAQVQDKDPQQHEANRDQVFGGFIPGSFHLDIILLTLRITVVKLKYEKSVI